MKKFYYLFSLLLTVITFSATSQNIAMNSTGAKPDSSALLDIQSNNKGLLVPRMTDSQRIAISSPATGLLLYQTNSIAGFYYNSGTPSAPNWLLLAKDNLPPLVSTPNDTTINLNTGDSIELTGSATDTDGSVVSYLWSQVAGPKPALFSTSGSQSTYLSNLTTGKYIFQLSATDNKGATGVKSVSVLITARDSIQLKNGLVAYYPFNNNTNDSSGNNNNGILIGGASLSKDQHETAASALDCAGNGQLLLVPNNGKIVFDSALSISFDLMVRSFKRHSFITMVQYNTAFGANFGLGTLTAENYLLASIVDNDAPCDNFRADGQTYSVMSDYILQPDAWYNVICTYNKSHVTLYINGKVIASGTSKDSTILNCAQDQLLIGGWWQQDPTASLDGKMDNVRLFNRELNTLEIAELSKNFK